MQLAIVFPLHIHQTPPVFLASSSGWFNVSVSFWLPQPTGQTVKVCTGCHLLLLLYIWGIYCMVMKSHPQAWKAPYCWIIKQLGLWRSTKLWILIVRWPDLWDENRRHFPEKHCQSQYAINQINFKIILASEIWDKVGCWVFYQG